MVILPINSTITIFSIKVPFIGKPRVFGRDTSIMISWNLPRDMI